MPNVRSKVASRISKIKEVEDFNFSGWLKKPLSQSHTIEPLTSYVADLDDIEIEFESVDFFQHNFDMTEPDVTDELKNTDFPKIRSNAIFFMIALPLDEGIVYKDVAIKQKKLAIRTFEFVLNNPKIIKAQVKFDSTPPLNYEFKIELPATQNYLSNLVPEVFKIDLLDFEDLVTSSKKVKVNNVGLDKFKKTKLEKISLPGLPEAKKIYRIKVPSIGVYKFSEQKIPLAEFLKPTVSDTLSTEILKVKNWFAKFKIDDVNTSLLFRSPQAKQVSGDKVKSDDEKVDPSLLEQLKMILSNVRKIDWEKSGCNLTKLEPYEETGAKFLAENDYALLQDEFGIDIQKEAIASLKLLFASRIIKTALIVTDENSVGNSKVAKHLNLEIGWSDKLKKYSPELTTQVIAGNNDERADLWSTSKPVVIADIDTVLNDYHLKIFESKNLEKIDCIILDSVEQIILKSNDKEEFLSAIHPKILWATSSLLDKNLFHELNSRLNSSPKIEKLLIRSKQSVEDTLPKFVSSEFWSEVDESQAGEFKTAFTECKKDLRRVLESGNPLRFYANIFTLYHKLNQIGNFALEKSVSPKSELLIHQLQMIKANGKKALILSQYEKLGTKKIGEILTNNEIKHVLAPNSLSPEEMKKAISTFQSQSDMVAFVTDTKISRLKFSELNLSYIIKFDQWWNPITNWEIEDMILKDENSINSESINLCNYYSNGILDQRIREMLLESGLMNKNVFELMQPKLYEELVLVDEWLKVFGMPLSTESKNEKTPEEIEAIMKKITVDDFRKILKRLFTVLGFSAVDIFELPNSNSFNLVGKSQRNGREFYLNAQVFEERKIEKNSVETVLAETSKAGNNKIFLITRDNFPEFNTNNLRENVTMLNGLALSKLLIRVGILPTAP